VILIAPDDWAGLRNALHGWLQKGAPSAQGAEEIIRQRYHPRQVALRHLEIYREVISANSFSSVKRP
jgi:hypothetical protein